MPSDGTEISQPLPKFVGAPGLGSDNPIDDFSSPSAPAYSTESRVMAWEIFRATDEGAFDRAPKSNKDY